MRWWRTFGRPPRIAGVDIARGLAVLGMVGAHVATTPELSALQPSTWSALVHGRSAILFAVLAGVSISLMSGRGRTLSAEQVTRVRLAMAGRGAAIFAIGVVLELLGTPIAVILPVYGVLYIASIPFLRVRTSRLVIAAAVIGVAGPPVLAGLTSLTLGPYGPGIDLVLVGIYPITVWLSLLLAGMALGRLPLERTRVAGALVLGGALLATLGYGVGALATSPVDDEWIDSGSADSGSVIDDSVAWGELIPADEVDLTGAVCEDYGDGYVVCYPSEDVTDPDGDLVDDSMDDMFDGGWATYPQSLAEYDPVGTMLSAVVSSWPHSAGSAEVVGSGGFAIALLGLCLLLSRPLRWLLMPLLALGSMPLTAYSAHVVAIFLLVGPQGYMLESGYVLWAWFTVWLLIGATVWSMFIGRGPLERLVGRAASAMANPAPVVSEAGDDLPAA